MLFNRFLEKLAALLEQHNFVIVVDEALTGDKCVKFLQTFQKPSSFAKRFNYNCLGKWMGIGMISARTEMLGIVIIRQTEDTTGTNYNEAILAFKEVIPHMKKIAEQREKVLELLNTDK
eukprot:10844976-Ditylum_brightwellii.AAC.1